MATAGVDIGRAKIPPVDPDEAAGCQPQHFRQRPKECVARVIGQSLGKQARKPYLDHIGLEEMGEIDRWHLKGCIRAGTHLPDSWRLVRRDLLRGEGTGRWLGKGPGIPRSERQKVCEPFYRIESSRNPDTGGVGLGLSVTRSIIWEHGGDIVFANRKGGVLSVRLELYSAHARTRKSFGLMIRKLSVTRSQ